MLETMVYNVWVTVCSTGCRTNARVGQMSVSDKCPCRANVRVGKMSVSDKCPCRKNVRVEQMSVSDKCPCRTQCATGNPVPVPVDPVDFFRSGPGQIPTGSTGFD